MSFIHIAGSHYLGGVGGCSVVDGSGLKCGRLRRTCSRMKQGGAEIKDYSLRVGRVFLLKSHSRVGKKKKKKKRL